MKKIFFDENIPINIFAGLKQLNISYRGAKELELFYIPETYGKSCDDEKWIPLIGQENGVVITYDIAIARRHQQFDLCTSFNTSIVFLRPLHKGKINYWETIKIIIKHWEEIVDRIIKSDKSIALRVNIAKVEEL